MGEISTSNFFILLSVDERSSDSSIGRGDFFFRFFFFVFSSVHFLVKGNTNSTIEQKKCKDYEKYDRLLVSKGEFNYRIPQRTNFNF